jgi:hypothetical protein
MEAAAIKAEATEILADLPNRISHAIRRHAQQRPDHIAQPDTTTRGSYGQPAAVVTILAGSTGKTLKHRPVQAARDAAVT